MSEWVHKAVVTHTQELKRVNREPVTLNTYGPVCGEPWEPGMHLDRQDEKVTCEACLAKGKSDG